MLKLFVFIFFIIVNCFLFQEAVKRVPENQFQLDPVKNMKIKEDAFLEIVNKLEKFKTRLESHKLHRDPERDILYEKYAKKMEVRHYILRLYCWQLAYKHGVI